MSSVRKVLSPSGVFGLVVVGVVGGVLLSGPANSVERGYSQSEGVSVGEELDEGYVVVSVGGDGHGDDCSCCCFPL